MSEPIIADIGEGEWEELSNFTPRPFTFKGYSFASMDGLLQSLKFPLPEKQARVRNMVGIQTKRMGKKKKWYLDQTLYWIDTPIDRHSDTYIQLIHDAFDALFEQNISFRDSLSKTEGYQLVHSKGHSNPQRTILTEQEFVGILERLRNKPHNHL